MKEKQVNASQRTKSLKYVQYKNVYAKNILTLTVNINCTQLFKLISIELD